MFKLLVAHPCVSTLLLLSAVSVFYVPETACGASDRVKASIKRHGGICTEFHESCTIQIKPNVTLGFDSYYQGKIFHEAFINESIKFNKILRKDDYEAAECTQG